MVTESIGRFDTLDEEEGCKVHPPRYQSACISTNQRAGHEASVSPEKYDFFLIFSPITLFFFPSFI